MATLVAAGAVAFSLGATDRAERSLRAAYDLAVGSGDRRHTAFATAFLGHVERERGAHRRGGAPLRRAREIYEEVGNDRGVAWAACDLGLLFAEGGTPDLAEALLREALLLFEALSYPWAVAVASTGLAGVRVAVGDHEAAGRLASRALRLHRELGDVRGIAQSLEVLADVAVARESPATAARLLGAAAAQRERVTARPTEAERHRTDRALATVAVRLGRSEAEREQRGGGRLSTAAALELAGRMDGGDTIRTAELTTRQLQVAGLVAAGHTNRQIARELGISEKTAELHVRNTMQRLAVHNRAGVAAWVTAAASVRDPA